MHSKPLTSLFPDADVSLRNPIDNLATAIDRYGEIRTFFGKYKNPVGIELEIENVSGSVIQKFLTDSLYWRIHEDHSLKVSGREFISLPLSGRNIDYAIHEFATKSEGATFLYSIRTSTHVHVNVSFMNWDEFISLVLLSAYAEPLLYSLCAPERRGNPYCYPIATIPMEELFLMHPDMKYCGINLAPVKRQMTLEYRQLHGTNDWRLLRRWVQVLSKLYYFAKTTSYKEVCRSLVEVSERRNHGDFLKRVFGATVVLFDNPSLCDENMLWVLAAMDYTENL